MKLYFFFLLFYNRIWTDLKRLLYLYPADQHWDQIHNCHWHQGYHLCQSHHYCHKHCQKCPHRHQLDPDWQLWGNYHMHHCKKRLYIIFIRRYHHSRHLMKIWLGSNFWKIPRVMFDPHWQLWGNYHMHHCKKGWM